MKRLLQAFLLCGLFTAANAQPIVLNDPDQIYYPILHSSALTVRLGSTTIDSLLQHPERYRFQPLQVKALLDGEHEHWLRTKLVTPLKLYLWPILPTVDHTIIYEVVDGHILQTMEYKHGLLVSSDGYLQTRRACALLSQPGKKTTLYIRGRYGIGTTTLIANNKLLVWLHQEDLFFGLYFGLALLISLYSLMLFARLRERENLLYTVWVLTLAITTATSFGLLSEWLPSLYVLLFDHLIILFSLVPLLSMVFAIEFLQVRQRSRRMYRVGLVILAIMTVILFTYSDSWLLGTVIGLMQMPYSLMVSILAIRQGFKPAWYYLIGAIIVYIGSWVGQIYAINSWPVTFWALHSVPISSALEILFFTLGLTYKVNLLKKQQDEAIQEQLRLTQENQQLIETQNHVLEDKVEQRTAELQESLTTLKATQVQLIQKEKLASLGELTAGIAHEIQNPLNFVNNFSEVSVELVEELKGEAQAGQTDEVIAIATDLSQNLQKISHHGRRASAIVKGMLEHSKGGSGEKEQTDLVRLTEECFKIAYQGYRSKHRDFSCELVTSFQPDTLFMQMVTQDIGRVVINLLNNAFYSVRERSFQRLEGYLPQIGLSITQRSGYAELIVKDNGTGIPETIREKIFQPFFTTKPTGEGTGLGLSLSHDIISKGYGGSLDVKSQEGQGSEFIIRLPT